MPGKHTLSRRTNSRSGFTLVELIVSVALVLIIMLLLAQVFDVAASTARKQRGTAENDQQARTFTILIKQDLGNRSMDRMVPFYPRTGSTTPTDLDRSGYFYYAENDPGNQTEDVLAFTVTLPAGLQPYQGHATVLVDPNVDGNMADDDFDGDVDEPDEADPANYLRFHPNQPEGDDGIAFTASPGNGNTTASDINGALNGIGMSRSAEIVYFMRGGNLYRRVLMIRQPYDETPAAPFPNNIMLGNYAATYAPLGSGQFYRDFDYSAYHLFDSTGTLVPGPRFNTIASLDNAGATEDLGIYNVPISLGTPHRRFGHNPYNLIGRPREFVQAADGTIEDTNGNGWLDPTDNDANGNGKLDDEFIGRFLSQETAHSAFGYPGRSMYGTDGTDGNLPYVRPDLQLDPATRLVNVYGGGYERRGEDILMTNVIEFDVKLFDDGLPTPGYVDLGHSLRESDYGVDVNGDTDLDDPVGFYNILNNRNFVGANGYDGRTIRQTFAEGTDYHYDTATKRYVLDTVTLAYGNRYDTWYSESIKDNSNIGTNEYVVPPPYRPYGPGPDGQPGVAGSDDDGFGNDDDGDMTTDEPDEFENPAELGFPGSDETVGPPFLYQFPLRGIQITVRFMDPSTDLIRQVTILQSFVDPQEF